MPMKAKTAERNRNLADRILRTEFKPRVILGKFSDRWYFFSLGNDSIMTNAKIILIADDA
jgi:hypothetical protein